MPADMNPHDLAKRVSALVNGSSQRQVEAFLDDLLNDHRTLQQQTWSLFMQFIVKFALKKNSEVDARNEYAHHQSQAIVDFLLERPDFLKPKSVVADRPWSVPLV